MGKHQPTKDTVIDWTFVEKSLTRLKHTVLVQLTEESGPNLLLREAYEHLQLPIVATECHLYSTHEEQMRWFSEM